MYMGACQLYHFLPAAKENGETSETSVDQEDSEEVCAIGCVGTCALYGLYVQESDEEEEDSEESEEEQEEKSTPLKVSSWITVNGWYWMSHLLYRQLQWANRRSSLPKNHPNMW